MIITPWWIFSGSGWLQWITSIPVFITWLVVMHNWWHNRCMYCTPPFYRPGQVPIPGTVHKACKLHAQQFKHTH